LRREPTLYREPQNAAGAPWRCLQKSSWRGFPDIAILVRLIRTWLSQSPRTLS
jgi:hypothetical protein